MINKYSWVEIGGSFHPTEIQAAFLFAQLQSFNKNLKKRKEIYFGYYNFFLKIKIPNLYFPLIPKNFKTNFHAFWLIFKTKDECEYVRTNLINKKIVAFIGYVPLHSSKVGMGMGYKPDDLIITEKYAGRILRLPLHNNMKNKDSIFISNLIFNLIKQYRDEL